MRRAVCGLTWWQRHGEAKTVYTVLNKKTVRQLCQLTLSVICFVPFIFRFICFAELSSAVTRAPAPCRISRQDQRRGPRRRQKADPKSTRPRGSQVTGPFTVVMPDARLNQSKTQEAFRHATGMRRCAIVLRRRRHGRQTVSQHLRRVPGKQSRTDPSDKGACCRCSSSQTPRQLLGSTRALPHTSVRHSHPECS